MITVTNINEAINIAIKEIGECEYDSQSSVNAGYDIYRSVNNYYKWYSVLNDRIEINNGAKSKNIWVNPTVTFDKKDNEITIDKKDLEILTLKARLYDLLCK